MSFVLEIAAIASFLFFFFLLDEEFICVVPG